MAKKLLHNIYGKSTLQAKLELENKTRTTISFYAYAHIQHPVVFRHYLYKRLEAIQVLGRIYIAKEGVNAQISLPDENVTLLRETLNKISFLNNVRLNIAVDSQKLSFLKLTIKVRPKIVADGLSDETFDVTKKGQHVDADQFNQLLDDPNTVCVDMRNHYESEIGHFKNAVTPDVDTFRESLDLIEEQLRDKKDKQLLMYCTGGIRCEKASAYFKHKGFDNVYQLEGGIIKYAQDVEKQNIENKFIGKNFVFDERMAETISDDVIARCHQCGTPFDVHSNCENDACHLLFLQCDGCKETHKGCCSPECHEFIQLPKEEQKAFKSGKDLGSQVFKKGRKSLFIEKYREWKKEKE